MYSFTQLYIEIVTHIKILKPKLILVGSEGTEMRIAKMDRSAPRALVLYGRKKHPS